LCGRDWDAPCPATAEARRSASSQNPSHPEPRADAARRRQRRAIRLASAWPAGVAGLMSATRLSLRGNPSVGGLSSEWAGRARPIKGRTKIHPSGNYVQVRYPRSGRWVTVAVSESRSVAIGVAAGAYRDLQDECGRTPTQVRVVGRTRLLREGGDHAIAQAGADILRGAEKVGEHISRHDPPSPQTRAAAASDRAEAPRPSRAG
jgi:hypothetical protein